MKRIFLSTAVFALSAGTAMAAVTMADIDVTGDSLATFEEARNAIPALDMVAFDEIDTNNDNRISATELEATEAQNVLSQHRVLGPKDRPLVVLDEDGDGFMNYDDFVRVHPDFTENAFQEIDTNNDNRVSYSEYYTEETQALIAACGAKTFIDLADIDANGDKFADLEELRVAFPKLEAADFKEMDLNKDNRVSSAEFLTPSSQCIALEHGS